MGAKADINGNDAATWLMSACERRASVEIIRLLFEHGASINTRNSRGSNMLEIEPSPRLGLPSSRRCLFAMIRAMGGLRKLSDADDEQGHPTAPRCFEFLVACDSKEYLPQDTTVVDTVMRFNKTDVKETLIEHAVADNRECVFTRTHLLVAVEKCQVDVVRRLPRSGVDPNPRDDNDIRPLELVLRRRNTLSYLARDEEWFYKGLWAERRHRGAPRASLRSSPNLGQSPKRPSSMEAGMNRDKGLRLELPKLLLGRSFASLC
ncbi:hypothetical protein DL766_000114 [Monosporascus sp. MC13-8B]|uniref:BRCT domain-containing protein n=1 Tax=Monosporascus cannonballus TaxID=155416 RepID=A0ABY0H5A2_9PEZI|nr:hypothetical protein DL762_005263 [Monosporascus cannonballus]RYO90436.1 hypothetical protein DL763_005356 [Monosporascus cannonballus]RYP40090.1 hypothetical protein DL766_000114 [Monosporascus sp. MC13-8B]